MREGLVRTAADTLRSHGDCPSHRKLGSGKHHPQHQGQTYTASRSPMLLPSRTSVAPDTASQNEPGSERKSAMIPVRRGEVSRPDRSQREEAEELRLACGCGLGALFDKWPSAPKANRGLEVLAGASQRARETNFSWLRVLACAWHSKMPRKNQHHAAPLFCSLDSTSGLALPTTDRLRASRHAPLYPSIWPSLPLRGPRFKASEVHCSECKLGGAAAKKTPKIC